MSEPRRPETSVIIPAYNAERFIERCLNNVLEELPPGGEVIVVDDGSTDGTLSVARRFDGARVVSQPNAGPAAARNHGLEVATGETIAFQDVDDLWPRGRLEPMLQALRAAPDAWFVLGATKVVNCRTSANEKLREMAAAPPKIRPLLSACLYRREVFQRVGKLAADLRLGEDVDWFARAREVGCTHVEIDELVLEYHVRDGSLTDGRNMHELNVFEVIRRSLAPRGRDTGQGDCTMNIDAPLVSVIIPAYNPGHFLEEAVASIHAQNHQPLEIVLVDDGSTDGVATELAARDETIVYLRQPNRGAAAARNAGLRVARGEVIAFLDADDLWTAGKLARQLEALRTDLQCDLVAGQVRHFHDDCLSEAARTRLVLPPDGPSELPSSIVLRRALIDRVGLFNEELSVGEGIDWIHRARSLGTRVTMLAEVVMLRRIHGGNTTLSKRIDRRDYLQVVRAALARRRESA